MMKFVKIMFFVEFVVMFMFGVSGNILVFVMLVCNVVYYKWKIFYRFVGVFVFLDLFGILFMFFVVFVVYDNYFVWLGG